MDLGAANRNPSKKGVGFDGEGTVIRAQGIAPKRPYLNETTDAVSVFG